MLLHFVIGIPSLVLGFIFLLVGAEDEDIPLMFVGGLLFGFGIGFIAA